MLINDLYFLYLHNKIAYITHLVGEAGKQGRITPEPAEQAAQLHQVGPQDGIALRPGDVVGKPLAGEHMVSPAHIGPVLLLAMPAFMVFRA